jgi:hypothetical protein
MRYLAASAALISSLVIGSAALASGTAAPAGAHPAPPAAHPAKVSCAAQWAAQHAHTLSQHDFMASCIHHG